MDLVATGTVGMTERPDLRRDWIACHPFRLEAKSRPGKAGSERTSAPQQSSKSLAGLVNP